MEKFPVRDEDADLDSVSFSLCRSSAEFCQLFIEVEYLIDRAIIRNVYFVPEWIETWWKTA